MLFNPQWLEAVAESCVFHVVGSRQLAQGASTAGVIAGCIACPSCQGLSAAADTSGTDSSSQSSTGGVFYRACHSRSIHRRVLKPKQHHFLISNHFCSEGCLAPSCHKGKLRRIVLEMEIQTSLKSLHLQPACKLAASSCQIQILWLECRR